MREEVRRSLVSLEPTAEGLAAVYAFAPELPVFAGHFPGRPLVPGVYLIEGLRQAAEGHLGLELRLEQIADARFTAPVGPGQAVCLEISLEPESTGTGSLGWIARAQLECAGKPCAKLRLRLGSPLG
jgi:3-hydroxymyristoyl/3-hydroxydecanoyl-(acyl carrier protein) dehydratase